MTPTLAHAGPVMVAMEAGVGKPAHWFGPGAEARRRVQLDLPLGFGHVGYGLHRQACSLIDGTIWHAKCQYRQL